MGTYRPTSYLQVTILDTLEALPFGTYEALLPGATVIPAGDTNLLTIGLDDLIAIKRHIGRPKDKAALAQLEAIKQTRDEPGAGDKLG